MVSAKRFFGQKIWNGIDFLVFSYAASANNQPKTYSAKLYNWPNGFWQKDVEKHRYLFICTQCISHIKQKHGVGQKVFWPKIWNGIYFLVFSYAASANIQP